MGNIIKRFSILILVTYLFNSTFLEHKNTNQTIALEGPILATVSFEGDIVFQDVGTNRVWDFDTFDSEVSISGWSPNGCELLVRRDRKWATLSIVELRIKKLPVAPSSHVIWSPDGGITVTGTTGDGDQVSTYQLNIKDHTVQPLFEEGIATRWLSETELLYHRGGDPFIWDATTKQSQPLGISQSVWYWRPSVVHYAFTSPNLKMRAAYYSIYAYRGIHSRNDDDPSLQDLKDAADEAPRLPGFDIYFFEEGLDRHVNIPSFLRFLEWSPSSQQIIVVSAPYDEPDSLPGVYIYDVEEDFFQRLDDLPNLNVVEPSLFEPTWSPDEEWLAIGGANYQGIIVYHFSDGEIIEIDEQLDGIRLWWSPLMSYSETNCES